MDPVKSRVALPAADPPDQRNHCQCLGQQADLLLCDPT